VTAIPPFDPSHDVVRAAVAAHGSPLYLYDEATLRARARAVAGFGGPFGFTPRFALKANPNRAILRLFVEEGLHFDASTVFEARRAIAAGIDPSHVQLTAQVLGEGFDELARAGVRLTACSLRQIELIGEALPGHEIGVRINPGEGSGHNNRTMVAGVGASFGIWHERIDDARAAAKRHGLHVAWIHHHVGSGGDPHRWAEIARVTLRFLDRFPEATCVNLGGGFKVARMPGEKESDLGQAAEESHALLRAIAERSGRELHLEIEPGTWLTATAGVIVGSVHDVVSTGADGYTFVKTDVGMAELLRPSMYGAQHALRFVGVEPTRPLGSQEDLLVVGPCCESGDILTPAASDPEELAPRRMHVPTPGDLLVVGGSGAYCASMPARNYNSIPAAPEVWVGEDGELHLLRRRQALEDVYRDELA
jgi:diaminopimelate decarboxylase